jgi:predicted transcriptional regulator
MKISQLRKIIKETIGEMAMDEMARTPGTGAAFTITDKGTNLLKQMKATGEIPDGIRPKHIEILKFLFQAKQEGKRVQKVDFAAKLGVAQPAVNALFKPLEEMGLVSSDKYASALGGTTSSTPKAKPNVQDMLGDLDFGDM